MKYFVIAILLVIYFEILGQYLQNKLNRQICEIGLGIGLMVFLSYAYITSSILTAMNCDFMVLIVLYSLFFITGVVCILKDIKKIKYRFSWLHLILVALVSIFVFYSLNQSLGNLHGFDTTFYLNFVTGNAKLGNLNSKSVLYGGDTRIGISFQYKFQSFYYFASYIVYLGTKLFYLYPATVYIWVFQILFYAFFFSLLLNTYRKIANRKYNVLVLSIILIGFYFGKLYFNSVFGFFGNSYRIVCIGYVCYFLKDYFSNALLENKAVVSIATLAACSVSSTSLFVVIILYFAVFIVNYKNDKKILRWMSISLVLPTINLLTIVRENIWTSIFFSIIVMLTIYLIGDLVNCKLKKINIGIILFLITTIFMLFMSYRITGNLFDFTTFTNNLSGSADMTIDLLDFKDAPIIHIIYSLVFLTSFIIAFVFNRKDKLLLVSIIIFIMFLNPFCCTYFYKVNPVYHRTWDAIINPFMYIFVISLVCVKINNKLIKTLSLSLLSLISILNINFFKPSYYHDSFYIDGNYNKLYKMNDVDFDVIEHLKEDINNNGVIKPKIVTQNILTQSMITRGEYIYSRCFESNNKWTNAEYQIYAIFYQEQAYDGFYQPNDADTENVEKYIKEAGIDYLVLDKEWCYFDIKTNAAMPLMYKIDEFKYPFYENEKYVIYHFDN